MPPSSLSLLCLPCAGASASMYLRWRRSLPAWIRVVPVELPGRGIRLSEPFIEDFGRLVARLCDEWDVNRSERFALFGHSMGALLAYGMARRLSELGRPMPCALLASGSPAPARRDAERFASRHDDSALIADLRQQGGTPDALFDNAELLRITLDTLGADYRVCESFRYVDSGPLAIPVHVFAGRDDEIDAESMDAWRQEAGNAFSLDWFDGGHFFIRQQEEQVLDTIERALTRRFEEVPHAAPVVS